MEEQQYLDLLQQILDKGTWEVGRNGRTKSIFGSMMRFSLANGKIPILTTKKVAWKTCLRELLWFIKGDMDNRILKEQNVHIWDANGSREFLDSRGLTDYEEDELGPLYGYQWRNFNKPFFSKNDRRFILQKHEECWNNGTLTEDLNPELIEDFNKMQEDGVDQLQQIIDALKDPNQRTSRRLVLSAWNPSQLHQMALPPCHILCQFNVHDGNKLSCAMYQRSADFFLGIPFNIASYSMLTHLIAKHCGLEAYEFVHFMGNCHIYEEHVDAVQLQLQRKPYDFPTLHIKEKIADPDEFVFVKNIEDYTVDDFELVGYQCHEQIKAKMIA